MSNPKLHEHGGAATAVIPSAEHAGPETAPAAVMEASIVTPAEQERAYERQLKRKQSVVNRLAGDAEHAIWKLGSALYEAVLELEAAFGGLKTKTRKQICIDVAAGTSLRPATIKKIVNVFDTLVRLGRIEVAKSPAAGYHQIADICMSSLPEENKVALIDKVDGQARANPRGKSAVVKVRKMIAALKSSAAATSDPVESSDFLAVRGFDSHFGNPGNPHRLPGQAIVELTRRWVPSGGNVLSVFAGDRTVLDAAALVESSGDHRAVDRDPDTDPEYADRVVAFDASNPDFADAMPKGWAAGLAVVAPPEPTASRTTGGHQGRALFRELEYPGFLAGIARNVVALLAPRGVVAVVTKGAVYGADGQGAVDLEFEVAKALHESKHLRFASRAVLHVARPTVKGGSPNEPTSLVLHVLVFRRGE